MNRSASIGNELHRLTTGPSGCTSIESSWRVPSLLLVAFAAIWLGLAIAPVNRSDWLVENLLVLVVVPWLMVTRQRMRFSNSAYLCICVFLIAHAIGAHFTYSLVPYDQWFEALTGIGLNRLLDLQRNHFDRLVHFLYGALILLPSVELFERYAPPRGIWRWLMPIFFVTSHSVIYELMEWLAALVLAPSLGEAYLGTQGDAWDAQKDMALASGGAIIAMALVAIIRRPRPQRKDELSYRS